MTFVRVRQGEDGIGRLASRNGDRATVVYFASPVGPQTHEIQVGEKDVEEVLLPSHTLVYWHDPKSASWRLGRTDGEPIAPEALSADEEHYAVRFPNSDIRHIPTSELCVLWAHGVEDPSDLVAERVTESAYFVEGRRRLGGFLATQRSACRGIVGFTASAIEYYPHQVAIVRRVLSDPIQRYILADEVGLGKTIEAGVLVRQHLAERGQSARVEIIVPPHLQPQWREELRSKFFIEPDKTVRICSPYDIDETDANATMLVVDEAHHPAGWAFSDEVADQSRFEALATKARKADSVLLLSATPVLNEEDGFLAMLHLIDPDGYPLTDREAFRLRVRERQAVADCVGDLDDSGEAFFIGEAIDTLEAAFGRDEEMARLCTAVRTRIEEDVRSEERASAIGSLRLYVSETYRLHRRLIRTRRDDKAIADMLPKRNGLDPIPCDEDSARLVASEFLEDWRRSLPAENSPRGARDLFGAWVESSFSHPCVLLRRIDDRIAHLVDDVRPAFAEEPAFLRDWKRSLEEALKSEPRAEAIARWSETEGRAIVFVDDSTAAIRVAAELGRHLGDRHVARYDAETPGALQGFRDKVAKILVVDGENEEGLNLQEERAAVILYDTPFAPQRLEQRIGRVDRLEGPQRIRLCGFDPVGTYERSWQRLLSDVARVFNRSIAPLQYTLSDATTKLRRLLVELGPAAIDDEAERLAKDREGLESELRRIRAQDAMDSLELDREEEERVVETLQEAAGEAEEEGRAAFDAWMEALRFESRGDCSFHYVHHIGGRRGSTLLPLQETVRRFEPFIDRKAVAGRRELPLGPFTLDSDEAAETGNWLLRVGHPFVSAVEAQLKNDVRGVAWAMWRHDAGRPPGDVGIFVGFDFTVDAEVSGLSDAIDVASSSSSAVQMIADASFPPLRRTVWVDVDGYLVDDAALSSRLSRKYEPADKGGTDVNLRFDRWLKVDEIRPLYDWTARCKRAREIAEQAIRDSGDICEFQRRAAKRLRQRLARVQAILRSRINHLDGAARGAEEEMLAQEVKIGRILANSIESLRLHVDTSGIVVLAPAPFSD